MYCNNMLTNRIIRMYGYSLSKEIFCRKQFDYIVWMYVHNQPKLYTFELLTILYKALWQISKLWTPFKRVYN